MTDSNDACAACRGGTPIPIRMAFQPIVDLEENDVFAYEALVRGPEGQPAGWVFERIDRDDPYAFDQACRVRAIESASELALDVRLSINFLPNAVYEPERCIRSTLGAAARTGFPVGRIVFEITEVEMVRDREHLQNIVSHYRERGFATAIDDFGAGYAGLNLLADFQPDLVKLDMHLIRGIDEDEVKRAIVSGMIDTCEQLGISVVAEGVESWSEARALRDLGVGRLQGYYFAKPAFEALPDVPAERLEGLI